MRLDLEAKPKPISRFWNVLTLHRHLFQQSAPSQKPLDPPWARRLNSTRRFLGISFCHTKEWDLFHNFPSHLKTSTILWLRSLWFPFSIPWFDGKQVDFTKCICLTKELGAWEFSFVLCSFSFSVMAWLKRWTMQPLAMLPSQNTKNCSS